MANQPRASQRRSGLWVCSDALLSVAAGIGKSYRTLKSYEEGSRNVTVASARALSRYMRGRAQRMLKAADALDKAINRKEERDAKETKAKK